MKKKENIEEKKETVKKNIEKIEPVGHYGFEILMRKINDLENVVNYQAQILDDVVKFLSNLEKSNNVNEEISENKIEQNINQTTSRQVQPLKDESSLFDRFLKKK